MKLLLPENTTSKRLNRVESFEIPLDLVLCGSAVAGSAFFLLGIILGLFTGGV